MKKLFIMLSCLVTTLAKAHAQEPITLRLNLVPKVEYSMRLVADQTVTVVAKNKKETLRQSISQDWIYDVREVRSDGTTMLGCKISAISFSRKAPNDVVQWNSRDGKPAPESIDYFEALVGSRFLLEMEATGRIRRVLGGNELTERVLAMSELSEDTLRSLRRVMRGSENDSTFKNIGNLMASFPAQSLRVGDTWQKLDPVSGDIKMDYDTVCTLLARENGEAIIGMRSTIKTRRAETVQPFFKGATQTGQIVVDEKSGWTKSAQVSLRNLITSPQNRIYFLSEMRLLPQ